MSLVLSGGGARALAQIGVIEELEKQGYEIASVAGTSMGAVVGAVFALGKMEEFKNWMYGLDRMKVFNLIDFTFSTQGLIKGDKVLNKMKEFISDENIEDLEIPFAAVAVDLLSKKEVVFTSGSIYEAIRATIAIPTVLTPVKTDKQLLVDGGILNNIPISHAKRNPNDVLVVVNVSANIAVVHPKVSQKEQNHNESVYLKKIKAFSIHLQEINPLNNEDKMGYFDLMNNTIDLMTSRIAEMVMEKQPPDMLIEMSRDSCSTFDFYRAEEMVEAGRLAAVKSIEALKRP